MTTLAVIADIHANYAAMEAARELLHSLSPDGVIFLGDLVTDFPDPRRTLDAVFDIRERYPTWMVRGNREDYLLAHRAALAEGKDDGWSIGSSTGSLLRTYEELTGEDLDFLASLPLTADIALPDCPVMTACHATPFASKDWIIGDADKLQSALSAVRGELLLCGHTHKPSYYAFPEGRILICPSLGIPQDPAVGAGITLLTSAGSSWKYRFHRVEYDREAFIREVEASPMMQAAPVWSKALVKSLRETKDYAARCANRAYGLARQEHHARPMEEYWIRAAKELGIL